MDWALNRATFVPLRSQHTSWKNSILQSFFSHTQLTLFCSRWMSRACRASLSLPSFALLLHSLCSPSTRREKASEGDNDWHSYRERDVKVLLTLMITLPPHILLLTLSLSALLLDSSSSLSARLSASSSCRRHTSCLSSALSCCKPISSSDSMLTGRRLLQWLWREPQKQQKLTCWALVNSSMDHNHNSKTFYCSTFTLIL